MGVELSRKKLQTASIVLLVIDASTGVETADRKIIESVKDKKTMYIINKLISPILQSLIQLKKICAGKPFISQH